MSYSQLFGFRENGDAYPLDPEFRNSHYIRVIWDYLAKKYSVLDKRVRELLAGRTVNSMTIRELKEIESAARFELMNDMRPVWDLQYNKSVTDDDWYCMLFTFDYVVVPSSLIPRVAAAFGRIDVGSEGEMQYRGKVLEKCMLRELADNNGLRGIALYTTSVTRNPWGILEETLHHCPMCKGSLSIHPHGTVECMHEECAAQYVEHPSRPYNLDKDTAHWFLTKREEWKRDDEARR